jgi:phage terminase large subunit-like protein
VVQLADIIVRLKDAELLPEKAAIGPDPAGVSDILDELAQPERGISEEQIVGVSQGWRLNSAIKSTERALAGGELVHCAQPLMTWCVGNAKVEPRGNAVSITKQVSGSAKIDPLMATFNAMDLMGRNPEAKTTSVYETRGIRYI